MLHRYVVVNVINVILRFLKPRYDNHWFKSRPRSIIVINVSEFLRSVGTLVIVRPEYMTYLNVRKPLLNLIIAYRKNRFWNECSNNHTNRPQIHTEAKDKIYSKATKQSTLLKKTKNVYDSNKVEKLIFVAKFIGKKINLKTVWCVFGHKAKTVCCEGKKMISNYQYIKVFYFSEWKGRIYTKQCWIMMI